MSTFASAITLAAAFAAGVLGFSASAQNGPPASLPPSPEAAPAGGGPKTPIIPKTPLPAPTPRAAQPGQSKLTGQPVDWPCIQPKVGQMSYGQVWSGPPLEEALTTWRQDPDVADLVGLLAARRTKPEDAKDALDRFVQAEGAEKNAKLTQVFAGVFEEINATRTAIINGIERYARKQRSLSERIKDESLKLASLRKDMATQNSPEFQQKEQTLNWDTRIYDERAQALAYVCESPVILEQLAFTRGRDIQGRMD